MNDQYIYGIHAVKALLKNSQRKIKKLYIHQEKKTFNEFSEIITKRDLPVEYVTGKFLDQKFPDSVHQGIVALATAISLYEEKDLDYLLSLNDKNCTILILDGITDPHNLGACLRSADAAGVNFVIIPKDKSAGITATVAKTSCGASEYVPIVSVTNLARCIEKLKQKGVWVYGAAGEAMTSIYDINFTGDIALIMGAEGKGLRRLTRDLCDYLFALPMRGSVSSLNVSVATGICLYEVLRQRGSS